jgi:phage/plasmid-like protein (TIGR03299 family)
MAHRLEIRNGEASMFYVGEPPWHKLGTPLSKPATAAEAIRLAKLDWRVHKVPLYASDGVVNHSLDRMYGVVRSDMWGKPDCPVLGIVGEAYTPLQNSEAFSFFDPIVGKDAAIYHTAGVLRDGERIWIMAKLPSDIIVKGDDVAEKYLLLSNSHDGQSSVQVKFTPIRVVCQNTLTMALSEGRTIRVAHTKDMADRLERARAMLGIIERRYDGIGLTFQRMCKVQVDRERLSGYLSKVFPDPTDEEDETARRRALHNRLLAEHLFDQGKGNNVAGVRGTLWAAYNGVTELVDHRETKQTDDRRLDAMWFGEGYSTKARAFRIAKEMLQQLAV